MVGRCSFLMALPIFWGRTSHITTDHCCEGGREEICWGTTVERGTFLRRPWHFAGFWEACLDICLLGKFTVFGYLFTCLAQESRLHNLFYCQSSSYFRLSFVFDNQYSQIIQTFIVHQLQILLDSLSICWCMDADLSFLIWLVLSDKQMEHLSQHPGCVSHLIHECMLRYRISFHHKCLKRKSFTPPKMNSLNLKMMVWKRIFPFPGVYSQVPC